MIAPFARFTDTLPFSAFFIALTVLPCVVRFSTDIALAFEHIEIGGIFQQRCDIDAVEILVDGEAGGGLRIHAQAAVHAALIQLGGQRIDIHQPVKRLHIHTQLAWISRSSPSARRCAGCRPD